MWCSDMEQSCMWKVSLARDHASLLRFHQGGCVDFKQLRYFLATLSRTACKSMKAKLAATNIIPAVLAIQKLVGVCSD